MLAHVLPSGEEQPIAFASRTFCDAERNHAQLDREALAVAFGVKKFHNYVCGREFVVWTDHKSLLCLLVEAKAIPNQASGRIIRWAIMMQGYQYQLRYRSGGNNQNADCLSRLPCVENVLEPPNLEETVHLMETLNQSPMTASDISKWTKDDPVLATVARYVAQGWPGKPEAMTSDYFRVKDELSLQFGCLLRGSRVVVPNAGRQKLLQDIHAEHPGITRMKSLMRSYMWWPKMDCDIETWVQNC